MLICLTTSLILLVFSEEWTNAQMNLKGTSSAGRRLFHSPMISKNGLSCGDCHSDFDEKRFDDGRIRAGHSLYNAYYRQTWWGKDPEDPGAYATAGEAAVVCVIHYMRNPEKLTAQQILDLTAYLKAISKRSVQPPLAIAPAADKTGEYTGFEEGNHVTGKELFYAACHSCHPNGNAGIAPNPISRDKSPKYYARLVREGDGLGSVLSGIDPTAYKFDEGRFKPFFGADRLTDGQIADIIAYIKTLPPTK
ncbi:MAG: c-type cytochrome [Candidatus Latescibacterota bacterium]|nr:c-type cytochrome [Candidatus Latescibacterota bacterium]